MAAGHLSHSRSAIPKVGAIDEEAPSPRGRLPHSDSWSRSIRESRIVIRRTTKSYPEPLGTKVKLHRLMRWPGRELYWEPGRPDTARSRHFSPFPYKDRPPGHLEDAAIWTLKSIPANLASQRDRDSPLFQHGSAEASSPAGAHSASNPGLHALFGVLLLLVGKDVVGGEEPRH